MALRSASTKLLASSESILSKSGGFHSTGVKRTGGHGHDEPHYIHAKHYIDLDIMNYQKIKMPIAVFTAFSIGVLTPIASVFHQQKMAASA